MPNFGLPTSVEIDGHKYAISTDFRVVLDICCTLTDETMLEGERAYSALFIFYKGKIPKDYDTALREMYNFLRAGTADDGKDSPTLVHWEKDYPIIISAVNRVLGQECRALPYMHWWTFVGAYMEIGECLFSEVVNIRDKQAHGKKLEKYEKEFMRRNMDLISAPKDQELLDIEKMIREGVADG